MTDGLRHGTARRSVAEIRKTGAAWVTETELAWLCDQADQVASAVKILAAAEKIVPGLITTAGRFALDA